MVRAALCESFEENAPLIVREIEPISGLEPDQVRIAVHAAALNFFDTLIIRNMYQYKPELPFSPGAECSGTVAEVGSGVTEWSIGDRVSCYTTFGACRTEVVVNQNQLARVPDGVSHEIAAGLPVTYGTAMHGLRDRGQIKQGENLVITGAAGGAGLAALEVGKRLGANVIALASTPQKLELCTQHGADHTIDYSSEDVRSRLKEITEGKGVDVVYDCVGGDGAETLVRALGWGGRFLVVGFAAGGIPKIPLNILLLKGAACVGVFWGAFIERDPQRHVANMQEVLGWCAEGSLRPHIQKVVPLDGINDALQTIRERKATGKLVISMDN